jgi:hypothetical protein
MTRTELITALLAARGSAAGEAERQAHAGAAAYAALEVEAALEQPRYILYRGREHLFVVATAHLAEHFTAAPAERAGYAEALGKKADDLAGADPILIPERALEELLAVPTPEGERPLPPERVLRLAVAAARGAALSSRMEIYPRGMPASRALRLGAGSLLGPKWLTADQVQQRIASRYSEAEPLPGRPRLDDLLEDAGVHYRWEAESARYTAPGIRPSYLETSSTWHRRTTTRVQEPESRYAEEAWEIERRLQKAVEGRRFLALTVSPRELLHAEAEILRRFEVDRINLEALLLQEMKEQATTLGASWDVVLRADAAPAGGRDWRNLLHLVGRAMPGVRQAIVERERPALLVYPGLLARYGQLGVFEELREAAGRGEGPGYIVLIAADAQSTMPVVDREPLPVVLASEWARVPSSWIRNVHRGRVGEEGVAAMGDMGSAGVVAGS